MNILGLNKILEYKNQEKGFTVIELLVVILVMVTIGGIVGSIFFVSLRSANKSNTTALVRQNGNAAITQMTRKIRYAKSLVGVAEPVSPPALPTYTQNCGTSTTAAPETHLLKIQNVDDNADGTPSYTVFSCPLGNNPGNSAITIDSSPITDTQVSKVKSCVLSCVKQDSGGVSVTISFEMVDKNDGYANNTGLFENNVQPIRFDTLVSLRNR